MLRILFGPSAATLVGILFVVSDAFGQQPQAVSKLSAVYRAAKGVEAVAIIIPTPTAAQVRPLIQAFGQEILVAEDSVSTARERQTLSAYRQAWELYRASLGQLDEFEEARARLDQRPSGSAEVRLALIRLNGLKAQLALAILRDSWLAAYAQLAVAHSRYLGKPPAAALVEVSESYDEDSQKTTRTLREGARPGLALRTQTGDPLPLALTASASFVGRTGPPEAVTLRFIANPSMGSSSSVQLTRAGQPVVGLPVKEESQAILGVQVSTEALVGSAPLGGVVFGHQFVLTPAQHRALALLVK